MRHTIQIHITYAFRFRLYFFFSIYVLAIPSCSFSHVLRIVRVFMLCYCCCFIHLYMRTWHSRTLFVSHMSWDNIRWLIFYLFSDLFLWRQQYWIYVYIYLVSSISSKRHIAHTCLYNVPEPELRMGILFYLLF